MGFRFEPVMTFDAVLAIVSIVGGVIALLVQRARERRMMADEIYQRLELASNDLFEFEAEHPEIARALWDDGAGDEVAEVAVEAHVSRILNLFEMAARFRKQGIVPPEVFGSWVIWYWHLCTRPAFSALWSGDLRLNYVPTLREIMDFGVQLHAKQAEDEARKRRAFFEFVAAKLSCNAVRGWLEDVR